MSYLLMSKFFRLILAAGVVTVMPLLVWAGPGAHGPNGEHLDAPQTAFSGIRQTSPRIEAKSDLFELVGTLAGSELSIFIDRFDTNEPVLKAKVELESAGMKAQAKFPDDVGSYSVDDPAMLKKLATAGEHPLVITVLAGKDSDLLDAVLRVEESPAVDAQGTHWEWWGLGTLVVSVLLCVAVIHLRSQRQRSSSQEGQA